MSLPWHRVIVRRLFVVRFVRRGGGDACASCIAIRRLPMECIGGLAVGIVVVPLVVHDVVDCSIVERRGRGAARRLVM
jgi:hypothetical protein